jgi:hypothetical protein
VQEALLGDLDGRPTCCVICNNPLNADNPDNPFTGEGPFVRVACTNQLPHVFHTSCIVEAAKRNQSCPMCRSPLMQSILDMLPDNQPMSEDDSSSDDEVVIPLNPDGRRRQ